MFNKGDLLQYGSSGVCKVLDIVSDVPGFDKNMTYYLMVPINNENSKIYLPTSSDTASVRPVMTGKEMIKVLHKLDELKECAIPNEKQCEQVYREAMVSLDCSRWLELLKTLCMRKQARALQGKKVTSTDERYFKNVSGRLTEEMTVALGECEAREEMEKAIEAFENCVSLT